MNNMIIKLYSPNFTAAVKKCEEIRSGKTDSLWSTWHFALRPKATNSPQQSENVLR